MDRHIIEFDLNVSTPPVAKSEVEAPRWCARVLLTVTHTCVMHHVFAASIDEDWETAPADCIACGAAPVIVAVVAAVVAVASSVAAADRSHPLRSRRLASATW